MSTTQAFPRMNLTATLLRMLGGMAAAAAALTLYTSFAAELRIADLIALGVALICTIAAIRLLVESFNPQRLGARLEVEGEGTAKEAASVRLQALLLLISAVAIMWPPVGAILGEPAPAWTYLIVVICAVVSIGYTVRFFQVSDEFAREKVKRAGWWTYFIGQTVLLAYASAERLGLTPPLTSWDVVVWFNALAIVTPLFSDIRLKR